MARFYDKVGYEGPGEYVNDVWTAQVVERDHFGDIIEATRSIEEGDKVNSDYRLQHRISIIGDSYALEHYAKIKYVKVWGSRWIVNSVRLERPRLLLSLGGVYNGRIPKDAV